MSSFLSTQDGACYYKTRLLPRSRAFSFAKCVEGNRRRFQSVSVVHGNGGWYVIYQPKSVARQQALYYTQYRQRELRAVVEGADYEFQLAAAAGSPVYRCRSTSGKTYQVGMSSCSCPDWRARGSRSGIPCKHQMAYRRAVAAGQIVALARHRLRQVTGMAL